MGKLETNCNDAFNFNSLEFPSFALDDDDMKSLANIATELSMHTAESSIDCKSRRKVFLFHATFRSIFLISPLHEESFVLFY